MRVERPANKITAQDIQQDISSLFAIEDPSDREDWIKLHLASFREEDIDALMQMLKEAAFDSLLGDNSKADDIAELIIQLSEMIGKEVHRGLGMRVKAQVLSIGQGRHQKSLAYYAKAEKIYEELGDVVRQANVIVTKVVCLDDLGQYDEARRVGGWAQTILEENSEWLKLATLHNNMALIHKKRGEYSKALAMYDNALAAYHQLGENGQRYLALTGLNRAIALRLVGEFDEAINENQTSINQAESLGQKTIAARGWHVLGNTHYLQGQHNEALKLFARAQAMHEANNSFYEAALCEFSSADALLELRRFQLALEKCAQAAKTFRDLGLDHYLIKTKRLQALAYLGLGRFRESIDLLMDVKDYFSKEKNNYEYARTEFEIAVLLNRENKFEQSRMAAQNCIMLFEELDLPIQLCQARLIFAKSTLSQGEYKEAAEQASKALDFSKQEDLPYLSFQGEELLGNIAQHQGDKDIALRHLKLAITELERIRGNVMTEFRPDFLEDKQGVYESTVETYLEMGRTDLGLEYADRAKSRVMFDLLTQRSNVSLQSKHPVNNSMVREIEELRAEREQLRTMESASRANSEDETFRIQQSALGIEKRITDLWHRLLIQNAEYATEAPQEDLNSSDLKSRLGEDELLIEYFVINDNVVAFVVGTGSEGDENFVKAFRLPAKVTDISELLQRLKLNLQSVLGSSPSHVENLEVNAIQILQQLHLKLIAPLNDRLDDYASLIIVPHGPLHFLPFHALHDGESYLIEKQQISYLPAAVFMKAQKQGASPDEGFLSIGHSHSGRLPFAVDEAKMIAEMMDGSSLLEEEATTKNFLSLGPSSQILHIAGHGEFRPDNPVFSGISLYDGWLTSLDIFNLRLQASLVTLSGCETGISLVGGGDELLGLMRAFFSAGAASLLLSQWAVDDQVTSEFMKTYYLHLSTKKTKGGALRKTQLEFLKEASTEGAIHRHPYFWAPFYLVGENGPL